MIDFEERPIRVILLSFYCILLGLCLFSFAANTFFSINVAISSSNLDLLLPVIASIILAVLSIIVGIGILSLDPASWKILFFGLLISITSIASLFFVFVLFLFFNISVFYIFLQTIQAAPMPWLLLLCLFLSQTIVFYHLTHRKTLFYFSGITSHLAEPF